MLKKLNKKRNKKGFTLVELVVVIAILAVLAMIAIPKLGSSRLTSQVAAHNANVRVLKSAGAMYLADNPEEGDSDSINTELKKYLDGDKIPEVIPDIEGGIKEFNVKIEGGNIIVSPGEVKIEEDKVVEISEED